MAHASVKTVHATAAKVCAHQERKGTKFTKKSWRRLKQVEHLEYFRPGDFINLDTGEPWTTSGAQIRVMYQLINDGFVVKVAWKKYQMTPLGRQFVENPPDHTWLLLPVHIARSE